MNRVEKHKKGEWVWIGALLAFSVLFACDQKSSVRPGMCIRGMPETMTWDKCSEAGKLALKKDNYAFARQYFIDAATRTEKLRESDRRFAISINNLVEVYIKQGNVTQAELILKRILAINEKDSGRDDLLLATNLDTLAKIYREKRDWVAAEQYVKRAIAIRVKKQGELHPDAVSSQNMLGMIYLDADRLAEAVPLLSWEILHENAVQAIKKGEYARAKLYLTQAVAKAEKSGQNISWLLNSLNVLAETYQSLGDFADAEMTLKHIVSMQEKNDGDKDGLIASIDNLAGFYQNLGKLADAEILLNRILSIHERKRDTHGVITSCNSLAGLYQRQNRFADAEAILKRALSETKPDEDSLDHALTLSSMARLRYAQGRLAEMEDFLKRVLTIRLKRMNPSDPEVISVQSNLTGFYMTQKRFPEADKIFTEATPAVRKSGIPVLQKISWFENYASLLQATNRAVEAEAVIGEYMQFICSLTDPTLIEQKWGKGFQKIYCSK